jgi:hypothetical protein
MLLRARPKRTEEKESIREKRKWKSKEKQKE